MPQWTTSQMPTQKGRSAVVTGTGGLGFETALELARSGAEVIVAGRDPKKGLHAISRIRAETSSSLVRFEQVDLANLQSVANFAKRLQSERYSLDLLVNNAGVMVPPVRQETADGFELQFGTNYLGHFALTAHLMPLLRESKHARVVTVSSVAARGGAIYFDDLQAQLSYDAMKFYGQSKLACLIFALELQRRSDAGRWGVASIGAHPGVSRTDLLHNAPGRWSSRGIVRSVLWFLFQPAAQGALPSLYAATSPQAKPGGYYGPNRLMETRGYPTVANIPQQALDRAAAERLWKVSEDLSGITFDDTL